jgi:release factor glutamine methyltransferase
VPDNEGIAERAAVERAFRDGRVMFMGLALEVARGALVPRAETELLARTAIAALRAEGSDAPRVIDMCCGAGNLACAIAHHVAGSRVWASDLTEPCVALARRNAEALRLAGRLSVYQGDLFAAVAGLRLESEADMVVCNPPYISQKRLSEDRSTLLELEPEEAFAAGPYGLSVHQRVVKDALQFLRPRGTLLVEIGAGQHKQVEMLFGRTRGYDDVQVVCDDAGEPRVVLGRRRA